MSMASPVAGPIKNASNSQLEFNTWLSLRQCVRLRLNSELRLKSGLLQFILPRREFDRLLPYHRSTGNIQLRMERHF